MLLAFAILTGCFPHNAKQRRQAKWIEGGALVGGIALLSVTKSGADCEFAGPAARDDYDSCRRNATIVGNIGLGLILGGLLGFAITTMTADEKPRPPGPLAQDRPATTDEPGEEPPKPALPGRTAARPNKH
jgi:hypothetical protein